MTILIAFSGPIAWLPWVHVTRAGAVAIGWLYMNVGIMTENYRTALTALVKAAHERHDA